MSRRIGRLLPYAGFWIVGRPWGFSINTKMICYAVYQKLVLCAFLPNRIEIL